MADKQSVLQNELKCNFCAQVIMPGEKYFSSPTTDHTSCRVARRERMNYHTTLVELHELRDAVKELANATLKESSDEVLCNLIKLAKSI